jgi:hypothetical protein
MLHATGTHQWAAIRGPSSDLHLKETAMLKDILVGIARQNVVVDVAMEVVETLTYETRMAAIMLPITGVGVGLAAAALLAAVLTGGHPAAWVALAVGALTAVAAGVRLYTAKQRVKALKDLVTAKVVRDAASDALEKGMQLARASAEQAAQVTSHLAGAGRHVAQVGQDAADKGKELARAGADQAAQVGAKLADTSRQAAQAGLEAADTLKAGAKRIFSRK